MNSKKKSGVCINDVKKACLEDIYERVQGKGRTWGKKTEEDNPYAGSHITLIEGDEVVVLYQPRGTGKLILKQFKLVEETELGKEVSAILKDNNFFFKY